MQRALRALPHGGGLPDEEWRTRHRAVLALLWAHVAGVAVFALGRGYGLGHSLAEAALVASLAMGATVGGNRTIKACVATAGLLTASAVVVHLSGGVIEAHFHFFVMVAVIGFYQDWLPFLFGVIYVVVHHGVLGALFPAEVFNHPAAWSNPWKWAGIHGALILAASAVSVVAWKLNEAARESLREAQERFYSAFDHASVGMALVGLDGRLLQVNACLTKLTGYSTERLLRKTFDDIATRDTQREGVDQMRRLVAGEIESYRVEKAYVHSEGHRVPVLLSVALVRDRLGKPLYLVAQMEDISERQKAEEYYRRLYEGQRALVSELREAHRLKNELFGVVSHEFRTPLAGIIGFASLLASRGDQLSEDSKAAYAETIVRQGERLNRLVDNLFTSGTPIEPNESEIANVAEAMDTVRGQLAETYDDVALDVAVSEDLELHIDPEALRLVLVNLVSNAVRHAAPHTEVTVRAHCDGDAAVVSVTNAGRPIPLDQRRRIFQPFQQGGVGRTADGIGLGLHVVRKLLTAYGGSIDVACGGGEVTFSARVPVATPARRAADFDVAEAAGI